MLFIGRADRQVKIRGYRIELNEIETILMRYPHIKEAVAFINTDDQDHTYIETVMTSDKDADPINIDEIKRFLVTYLPAYAIPQKINFVDAISRTEAGKVDYKSLIEKVK